MTEADDQQLDEQVEYEEIENHQITIEYEEEWPVEINVIRAPQNYKDIKVSSMVSRFFVDFMLNEKKKKIESLAIMSLPRKMFVLIYPEIKSPEFESIITILNDKRMFIINDQEYPEFRKICKKKIPKDIQNIDDILPEKYDSYTDYLNDKQIKLKLYNIEEEEEEEESEEEDYLSEESDDIDDSLVKDQCQTIFHAFRTSGLINSDQISQEKESYIKIQPKKRKDGIKNKFSRDNFKKRKQEMREQKKQKNNNSKKYPNSNKTENNNDNKKKQDNKKKNDVYKKKIVIGYNDKSDKGQDFIGQIQKYIEQKQLEKALCVWTQPGQNKELSFDDFEKINEACGAQEVIKTKLSNVNVWIYQLKNKIDVNTLQIQGFNVKIIFAKSK